MSEDKRPNVIQDRWVTIQGVEHFVKGKFVACDPSLNNKAWNVTEKHSVCPKCAKVSPNRNLYWVRSRQLRRDNPSIPLNEAYCCLYVSPDRKRCNEEYLKIAEGITCYKGDIPVTDIPHKIGSDGCDYMFCIDLELEGDTDIYNPYAPIYSSDILWDDEKGGLSISDELALALFGSTEYEDIILF